MKMNKKTSWKLRLGAACLCILLTAGVAWAAGLFDRDDQTIRGKWTFEQDVTFEEDVDIDGTLSAQQYSSVFYVHSGTGGDVPQFGKSRNSPLATVEYAINRCTANKGDIVVVMPGHNEGSVGADFFDADIAGVSIIGFGRGSLMPTFDFDSTTANAVVGASNVLLQGLRFRPSISDIEVGIQIEASNSGVIIRSCDFGFAETATDEFLTAIKVDDEANFVTIENCLFDAEAQTANSAILLDDETEGVIIRNNIIKGDYAIANINGDTAVAESLLIDNNHLWNGDPSGALNAQPVIELFTGSTGLITRNMIFCDTTAITYSVVADGCALHENYMTDDIAGAPNTTALVGTASTSG